MPKLPHRYQLFKNLLEDVHICTKCPHTCENTKVLSLANGRISAKVMFIGEAPGRLGADKTGIPFHGDASGRNFEQLLRQIGWKRQQVFVTNCLLCNPRDVYANNRSPDAAEIENCLPYLKQQIDVVNPVVVVTIGAVALKTLALIKPHGLYLRRAVGNSHRWYNKVLFPVYHTSPRVFVFHSSSKQLMDFRRLSRLVNPVTGKLKE